VFHLFFNSTPTADARTAFSDVGEDDPISTEGMLSDGLEKRQQQNDQTSNESPCAPQKHAPSKQLSSLVNAISGTVDGSLDDALLNAILKRTSECTALIQNKQQQNNQTAHESPCAPVQKHTQSNQPSSLVKAMLITISGTENNQTSLCTFPEP